MTRGGLSIDQKMVDTFINGTIKEGSDFDTTLDLTDLGYPGIKVDFTKAREFFSRGLCLDLQRRERGSSTIKMGDLKRALNSPDPLEYLKSKGYDSKILQKLTK